MQDDTVIFKRALELAATGQRTTVWQLDFEISDEILESIKRWYNEQKVALYNFPDENGKFEANEYNCATFPKLFEISLPMETGLLKEYVMAMRARGAVKWQG